MKPKWRKRCRTLWDGWAKPMLVVLAVGVTFRSAVADWNEVPTGSMKPTILVGDRIFVNKLAYGLRLPLTTSWLAHWGEPQRGDIVVFFSPRDGTRLVKRVVGVPGDAVALHDNRLTINGKPAAYAPLDAETINQITAAAQPDHRFAAETIEARTHAVMATPRLPAMRSFDPIKVPPGQYFMLGDNRDVSGDSRFFGCVRGDQIVGRAGRVLLSLDGENHHMPRWDRFFRPLP